MRVGRDGKISPKDSMLSKKFALHWLRYSFVFRCTFGSTGHVTWRSAFVPCYTLEIFNR